MTIIREAESDESRDHLQGDPGFVAETDGQVVGSVAYNEREGVFYVHSLRSIGVPTVAARLIQAIRKTAKGLGYREVIFCIRHDRLDLLRLVESKRARVVNITLELST